MTIFPVIGNLDEPRARWSTSDRKQGLRAVHVCGNRLFHVEQKGRGQGTGNRKRQHVFPGSSSFLETCEVGLGV